MDPIQAARKPPERASGTGFVYHYKSLSARRRSIREKKRGRRRPRLALKVLKNKAGVGSHADPNATRR
jgi:hypothetical protein